MLSRVTPKLVVARTPQNVPPCFAVLVVTVDGDPLRQRVWLRSGVAGRRVARADNVDDVAPF
jgi:hypothetical protein